MPATDIPYAVGRTEPMTAAPAVPPSPFPTLL